MTTTQPRLRRTGSSGQLSQYDLLLVAIPLALAAGIASTFLVSVPLFVGAATGSIIAAGLVGYGIYTLRRVDPPSTERAAQPHGDGVRIE